MFACCVIQDCHVLVVTSSVDNMLERLKKSNELLDLILKVCSLTITTITITDIITITITDITITITETTITDTTITITDTTITDTAGSQ